MPDVRAIPVIDLKGGEVVHAIGGRRAEYKPIISQLTPSSRPLDVAQAFRDKLGLTRIYIADLDAIAGGEPAWPLYAELLKLGLDLIVDAGVADLARAMALKQAGIGSVVAALETLPGPEILIAILDQLRPKHVIFSLDLKAGQPMGNRAAWNHGQRYDIAQQALNLGVRRMIVLDLEYIGKGAGPGTELLCKDLREVDPKLEIIVGGGIRSPASLKLLEQQGVSAALVATAFHNGRIRRAHLVR